MTTRRPTIRLVPLGNAEHLQTLLFSEDTLTLRALLAQAPALSTSPLTESLMDRELRHLLITLVEEPWDCPLYRPPGMTIEASRNGSSTDMSQNQEEKAAHRTAALESNTAD